MIRSLAVAVLLITACTLGTPRTEPPPQPTSPAPPAPEPTGLPAQPVPTSPPAPEPTEPPTELPPAPPTEAGEPRPPFTVDLEPIVGGFDRPVHLTHAGDGSGRLFVVEQPGRIRVIEDGTLLDTPFLDITELVNDDENEQGLLSVAFHPDYAANGLFYVNYTREPDGATSIESYRVSADRNVADPATRQVLLTIDQPEDNHNGGLSAFGLDGFLYIGTGDGGGADDQHGSIGNAQDPDSLLGKMLRMDVATGEVSIWAIGLRNPWRFSFDRASGDLYIADVGQDEIEEVNFQPASSLGGENYGWRIMEGFECFDPEEDCDQTGLTLPVVQYDHGFGCSITGGHVYRGAAYPWLDGLYFFADFCTGIAWTLERDASGEWQMVELGEVGFTVSSFGEDEDGELYLLAHGDGVVYRLTSTSP